MKMLRCEFLHAGERIFAEAEARGWQTHPAIPLIPDYTLVDYRQQQALMGGYCMVCLAVRLDRLSGGDGYNLGSLLASMAHMLTTLDLDAIDHEARRGGLAPKTAVRDPRLWRAHAGMLTLLDNIAKHCADALQHDDTYPLHRFYEFLAPSFGHQGNQEELRHRFDPVILPLLAALRRKLADGLSASD